MPPTLPGNSKGDGDQYTSCARRITTLLCGDAEVNGEETLSEWEVFVRRRVAPTAQPAPTNLPSLIALVTAAAMSGFSDPAPPPIAPPTPTIPLRRRVTSKKQKKSNAGTARRSRPLHPRRSTAVDDGTPAPQHRSSSNSPERCCRTPFHKRYSPARRVNSPSRSADSPERCADSPVPNSEYRSGASCAYEDKSHSPARRSHSPARSRRSPTRRSKLPDRGHDFGDGSSWLVCPTTGTGATEASSEDPICPAKATKSSHHGRELAQSPFPGDRPRGTEEAFSDRSGGSPRCLTQPTAMESPRVTPPQGKDSLRDKKIASHISFARGRARRRASVVGGSDHSMAGSSVVRRLDHSFERAASSDTCTSLNAASTDPPVPSTPDSVCAGHLSPQKSTSFARDPADKSASGSTIPLTYGSPQFRLRSLVDWLKSPWSQRLQKGCTPPAQDDFAEAHSASETIPDRCKSPTTSPELPTEQTPTVVCSPQTSFCESDCSTFAECSSKEETDSPRDGTESADECSSEGDEEERNSVKETTGECEGREERRQEKKESIEIDESSRTEEIDGEVDAEGENPSVTQSDVDETDPAAPDERYLLFEMATDSSLPPDGEPIPTVSMIVRRIDFVDSDEDSVTLPTDLDNASNTSSAIGDVESIHSIGSSSNLDIIVDDAQVLEDYPGNQETPPSPERVRPRRADGFPSSRSRPRRRARYVQRDAQIVAAEDEMDSRPSVLGMLPAGYRESDDMLFAHRQRLAAAAVSLDRLLHLPEESEWTALYRPAPRPLPIPEEIPPGSQPFMTSIASVISSLECPICFAYMVKNMPILLCVNGHNVCGYCQRRVSACPVCRGRLLVTRNLALESIASVVEFRAPPAGVGGNASPVKAATGAGRGGPQTSQ